MNRLQLSQSCLCSHTVQRSSDWAPSCCSVTHETGLYPWIQCMHDNTPTDMVSATFKGRAAGYLGLCSMLRGLGTACSQPGEGTLCSVCEMFLQNKHHNAVLLPNPVETWSHSQASMQREGSRIALYRSILMQQQPPNNSWSVQVCPSQSG